MTEEQARATLLAHGVPEALFGVWIGTDGPLRDFSWRKPNVLLAEELERRVPELLGLCPLFEHNGEAVIGYLPHSGGFVRYYYEDAAQGAAAIEVMGIGYQQFASSILLEASEAGMDDLFDELASYLQFSHGTELRALLDAAAYDESAIESFHAGLAARPR